MALPGTDQNDINTIRTEQDYASAERQKIISGQNVRTEVFGSIRGKFQNLTNEANIVRSGVVRTMGNNVAAQGVKSIVGSLGDIGSGISSKLFGTGEKQFVEQQSEIADEIDKSKLLKAVLDSMLRLEKISSGGGGFGNGNGKGSSGGFADGSNFLPVSSEETKKMSELEKARLDAEKFSESLKRKLVEVEQPGLGSIVQSNMSNVTGTIGAGIQQGVFGALGSNVLSQVVMGGVGTLSDTIDLLLSKSSEKKKPEEEQKLEEQKTEQGTPFPEINSGFDKPKEEPKAQETDYDIPAYKRRAKGEKSVNEEPPKTEETDFDISAYKRRGKKFDPVDVPFRDIQTEEPKEETKTQEEGVKESKKQSGILQSLLERMTEIRDYFKRNESLSSSESDLESAQGAKRSNPLLERAKAREDGTELAEEKSDDGFGLKDAADIAADIASMRRGPKDAPKPKPKPNGPAPKPKPSILKNLGAKLSRLKGGIAGMTVGLAADVAADKLEEEGHTKSAAGVSILGSAAAGAGFGSMLGPLGAAVGASLGGAYGVYQNWDKLTDGYINKVASESDKLEADTNSGKGSSDGDVNVVNSNNTSINNSQTTVVRKNARNPDQTLNRYLAWGY